jgi:hypothetical protein
MLKPPDDRTSTKHQENRTTDAPRMVEPPTFAAPGRAATHGCSLAGTICRRARHAQASKMSIRFRCTQIRPSWTIEQVEWCFGAGRPAPLC